MEHTQAKWAAGGENWTRTCCSVGWLSPEPCLVPSHRHPGSGAGARELQDSIGITMND